MLNKFTVNKDSCSHCGLCISDCPAYIIEFNAEKIPQYIQGKENYCIGCQHCMAICPTASITFGNKKPENSLRVSLGNNQDFLNLIQSRRSIRVYRQESVETNKINKIIEMLPYIPTAKNADDLYFSIIATKEKMDELRRVTYEKICASPNPNEFFILAKKTFEAGHDLIYRGAPAMMAVAVDQEKVAAGCETVDPIIAATYFELYAQTLGLGTTWCGYAFAIANQIKEVYELLEIPPNCTLGYTILFGNPAVKYLRTTQPEMFKVKLVK